MEHATPLPAAATREQGVAMLQDHDFFLRCDPHLVKYSELKPTEEPAPLPSGCKRTAPTKTYEVHDLVHNLPRGLWDSNVVSTYELTDIEGGVHQRVRSPMAIVMNTVWLIRESEGGKGFELVESISISASRLLLPIVKSLCEGGWKAIHDKMMDRLAKEEGQSQEAKA